MGMSNVLQVESHELLPTAIDMLSGIKNPLEEKLLELGDELERRDKEMKTIFTRLSGHRKEIRESDSESEIILGREYYLVKESDIGSQILKALGRIQDEKEQIETQLRRLSQENEQILAGLGSINDRIPKSIESGLIVERIHKYIDELLSKQFCDDFLSREDLDELFARVRTSDGVHPRQFIPKFCEKYKEMEEAVVGVEQFVVALDRIFVGLSGWIGENRFGALQGHVNDLHAQLNALGEMSKLTPVFVVISRFVALVQTLVAHVSASGGTEIRIV
jgi:vacuolar-type H+-ATPase subunit I/STV1